MLHIFFVSVRLGSEMQQRPLSQAHTNTLQATIQFFNSHMIFLKLLFNVVDPDTLNVDPVPGLRAESGSKVGVWRQN